MQTLIEKNNVLESQQKTAQRILLLKRILSNDFSVLLARSDEGKSMFLAHLIKEYTELFKGNVWGYGLKDVIYNSLHINRFNSVLELEQIRDSIIVIDEIGTLFPMENRKNWVLIERTFRLVNHNGNRIIASGLCFDFKKWLSAKARCFMYKGLNLSDLINGSLAKNILMEYHGDCIGSFSLEIPKNKVLLYDGHYDMIEFPYYEEFDTKKDNIDLFQKKCEKNVPKCGEKK